MVDNCKGFRGDEFSLDFRVEKKVIQEECAKNEMHYCVINKRGV